ncbi:MAG: carotenoid oxygenase family protein [Calothrix sp. MO_167.B12]|nr:carotenoid oxygenase family protein [Calothrix sp. MO_167.B12]
MKEEQSQNNSEKTSIPKSIINANSREEIEIKQLNVRLYQVNNQHKQDNFSELEYLHKHQIELPESLQGYVFICGVLCPGKGTQIFNGDGMIYRLGFEKGKANIKTSIAKTPCYYADQATQKNIVKNTYLYKFFDGGLARTSIILGSRNQLNTAFVQTKDNLVITFDAGRPYEIDPDTMELLEPVGITKEWLPIFPAINRIFQAYSTVAHPAVDLSNQNGSDLLFTVNYSTGYNGRFQLILNPLLKIIFYTSLLINKIRGWKQKVNQRVMPYEEFLGKFTDLVRYNFKTKKIERWRLTLNGQPLYITQAVHQIAITKDYLIIPDISFMIEYSQILSPFLFDWIRKKMPIGYWISLIFLQLTKQKSFTTFYIVRRPSIDDCGSSLEDGEALKELPVIPVKIPREVSHFTVDYDNPGDKITLHIGHRNGWDVTEWISSYDQPIPEKGKNKLRPNDLKGMIVGSTDLGFLGRYIIDARTGELLDTKLVSDSNKNTWSLSVYTHREICRERETERETKVKNIYWVSWGFSWELIPERIYEAYTKNEYRTISSENLPKSDQPATLLRLDTESMQIVDSFAFPHGYFACSPQFIPTSSQVPPKDKDESIDGYILCVVFSDENPQGEFWVFHADNFHKNPIYRLSHPKLNLRFTIHSTWLPDINKGKYSEEIRHQKRESVYLDYEDLIRDGSAKTQKIFDEVVYPHFIEQTSEEELQELLRKPKERK